MIKRKEGCWKNKGNGSRYGDAWLRQGKAYRIAS